MSTGTPHRRRLRSALVLVLLVAIAGAATVAWLWRPWTDVAPEQAGEPDAEVAVVPVETGTLTSQLRLNATLGYGDPVELPVASGIITALPVAGQEIEVGSVVYETDGRPVVLMEGARPFWRDLSSDADDGQDVLQLEQNLARLGYFDREPDTTFDWWTTDAVIRWQKSLGLTATGAVAAADVVAVDAPSIRVSQVTGKLGQTGVSPVTCTTTTLRAVAKLTAAQARELQAGAPVTVVLPDGTELKNTIAAVDPGGQLTGEDGQTTPPTATIEFSDQEQVAPTGPANVRVVVQNSDESIETLIVPVTALVATARGTYAVEVQTPEEIVRVPVQIGQVADARVQVVASGPDVEGAHVDAPELSEGDEVVISR